MAYVITDDWQSTCDLACVNACPVDAIHGPLALRQLEALSADERAQRKLRMYIDPEACIGCAACEPECPVEAIFDEDDLPASQRRAREDNAAFFARTG